MKYLNWLKIQKCYPHPLIFESVQKIWILVKKKKLRKTTRATGLKSESIMPIIILHNRFDLWHGIINTFFNNFFLRSIFTHFYYIFDPHCPVQVNRENFQVQNFAFLTSELKSTLNFSLENIIFYILANFFFSHQMSAKPWSDLEPCHKARPACLPEVWLPMCDCVRCGCHTAVPWEPSGLICHALQKLQIII